MGLKDMKNVKKLSMLRSQIDSHDVEELMEREFKTVGPDDSLEEILSIMRNEKIHDIPVVDGNAYMGMVSYGTVIKRKNLSPDTKAKSVLINFPTIHKSIPLTTVAEYMVVSNARELPVMNGNRVIGTISRMSLARMVSRIKGIREIKVWEIMSEVVESAKPKDDISTALEIMRALDVRTLPVVNDQSELVGILGMREVIDYNWQGLNRQTVGERVGHSAPVEITVDSLCVTNMKKISWDSDVGEAASIMYENDISTLPVMEDGKMVGIVTKYDIMELIAACQDREMVFVQISGMDEDDRYYMESMDKEIRNELTKMARMYKPQVLTIHVAKYNEQGGGGKYSLTGRLTIGGTILMAKSVDWDLVKTTEDLMRKLLGMVNDMKEEKVDRRTRIR